MADHNDSKDIKPEPSVSSPPSLISSSAAAAAQPVRSEFVAASTLVSLSRQPAVSASTLSEFTARAHPTATCADHSPFKCDFDNDLHVHTTPPTRPAVGPSSPPISSLSEDAWFNMILIQTFPLAPPTRAQFAVFRQLYARLFDVLL